MPWASSFAYVVQAGIPSYVSPKDITEDACFVYKCGVKKAEYARLYKERPLVEGNVDELAETITVVRKVVPPKLTSVQMATLAAHDLIAFPILLVNSQMQCTESADDKRHLFVAILNKLTHTVEIIDPFMPTSMPLFSFHILVRGMFAKVAIAKMQTLLQKGAPRLEQVIPRFDERHYRRYLAVLKGAGVAANNHTAHAAFTASYVQLRAQHPAESPAAIVKRVYARLRHDPDALIEAFNNLAFVPEVPKTDSCRRSSQPSINIDIDILEAPPLGSSVDSNYFMDEDLSGRPDLVTQYLKRKYRKDATIIQGDFMWDSKALSPPTRFASAFAAALKTKKRFVIMTVHLSSDEFEEAHANALIFDKQTRELERYEPNGGKSEQYKQAELDAAVDAYFKGKMGDDGVYVPPKAYACPIGLQKYDAREHNKGARGIGGNCAIWALYYVELRLRNPDVPRKAVLETAEREIRCRGSFTMFINAYHWAVLREMRK